MASFLIILHVPVGCFASIPAVQWVCIYAVPTIALNFIYQCTFFVSCLILDERRISANRLDGCFCYSAESKADDVEPAPTHETNSDEEALAEPNQSTTGREPTRDEQEESFNVRFMRWYATQLMKPWVKVMVLAIFTAYFGFCVYCATNLTQRFRTKDFVPEDSFVAEFLETWDTYTEQVMGINVYFRGVNQSDPAIQAEMRNYMRELTQLPAVNGTKPPLCWVMDFEEIKKDPVFDLVKDLPFSEQVSLALSNPNVREAYGDDIVQDENGTIVASRCWLNPKYLDLNVVSEQVDLLKAQRAVSRSQPLNFGLGDKLKFFTFDPLYYLWVSIDRWIYVSRGDTQSI